MQIDRPLLTFSQSPLSEYKSAHRTSAERRAHKNYCPVTKSLDVQVYYANARTNSLSPPQHPSIPQPSMADPMLWERLVQHLKHCRNRVFVQGKTPHAGSNIA